MLRDDVGHRRGPRPLRRDRDFTKIDQSQLARVAERHGVHKDTVWRRRRDFPELLASCILKAPSAEYFELRTQ